MLTIRQILSEIIASDDIVIITIFQARNMIKLNVHFSTEIINRAYTCQQQKNYPDFSRTTRENYLSVNPVECTCLFISVSISCSFLYICMFHSYHFLQRKPFICSGKSHGCKRFFFKHLKLFTYTCYNYDIFKKK